MAEAKKLNLGGIALPLDVEGLEVLPVHAGGMAFDFVYRHIRFTCRYQEDMDAEGGRLHLTGDVGPLPYTAESVAARSGIGQILDAANELLGPVFRISQGRIHLATERPVPPPLTATHVVSAIAAVLIPATPYLELISVYVRPPLAAARPGETALQPEWRRRPGHRPAHHR